MQRRPAWFVGAALIALGQHRANATQEPFTAADMVRWVPAFPRVQAAMLAIKVLLNHRYLEPALTPLRTGDVLVPPSWYLTADGAIAATAAYQENSKLPAVAYGPMTPAAEVDPFAARLWSLLRIRKALTSDEAASLLVDAGDNVDRARKKAGALLLAWSRRCPQAVRVSARRMDGCKRYVLVTDVGPTPPDLGKGATRA